MFDRAILKNIIMLPLIAELKLKFNSLHNSYSIQNPLLSQISGSTPEILYILRKYIRL